MARVISVAPAICSSVRPTDAKPAPGATSRHDGRRAERGASRSEASWLLPARTGARRHALGRRRAAPFRRVGGSVVLARPGKLAVARSRDHDAVVALPLFAEVRPSHFPTLPTVERPCRQTGARWDTGGRSLPDSKYR